MQFRNYYSVLNVARDATLDDIQRAYARLKSSGASEPELELAREAYFVLSDPALRRTHDLFLDRMSRNTRANYSKVVIHEIEKEIINLPYTPAYKPEARANAPIRWENLTPAQNFLGVVYFLNILTPGIIAWMTGKWIALLAYLALPLYLRIPQWIVAKLAEPEA